MPTSADTGSAILARRIAIVEDEAAIRENYADVLRRQGYTVAAYAERPQAMAAFRGRLPDLVLIDVGLGDEMEGGFDLCRELRALSPTLPIVFLTARDSDVDAVSGFRLGADDYLVKGISVAHLTARIAALFRRLEAISAPPDQDDSIERGPLLLNLDRMTVTWQGAAVDLTLTELWLVHSLARRPGHVKNREQLMGDANIVVDDATITSHIKRIRRKFAALDPSFAAIESVYGMGYRWKAE
jgi:two-component system OmpR family response regulator